MTTTIPTSLTLPTSSDFNFEDPVNYSEWKTLIEAMHYHWQRCGALVPGMTFDPAFQTTSTSYTSTNSAASGPDLDAWCGVLQCQKLDPDGNYVLEFDCYLQNLTVRFTAYRFDDRTSTTSLGTVEVRNTAATSAWKRGWLTIAEADAHESGSTANPKAVIYLYAEAKVPSTGTGYLWQF